MREVDEITARGSGVWGGARYSVEVLTNTRTWFDAAGDNSWSLTEWHLSCSGNIGRRRFSTELDRNDFISESFTLLDVEEVVPTQQRGRRHALNELIGQRLASVWFVADYVQLRFDEPPINLYVMPAVHLPDGEHLEQGTIGYADALVGQIGASLLRTDELLDLGLVLDLDSGVRLAMPLGVAPFPEVAEFHGQEGGWIWTGGEPPWDAAVNATELT